MKVCIDGVWKDEAQSQGLLHNTILLMTSLKKMPSGCVYAPLADIGDEYIGNAVILISNVATTSHYIEIGTVSKHQDYGIIVNYADNLIRASHTESGNRLAIILP